MFFKLNTPIWFRWQKTWLSVWFSVFSHIFYIFSSFRFSDSQSFWFDEKYSCVIRLPIWSGLVILKQLCELKFCCFQNFKIIFIFKNEHRCFLFLLLLSSVFLISSYRLRQRALRYVYNSVFCLSLWLWFLASEDESR